MFKSKELNLLVEAGKLADENSRYFIRSAIGVTTKKVEATRHAICSGPPGVGKSFGTTDECDKAGVNSIVIPPGISDIALTIKLACGVHSLKDGEELVVILDDADDVVFNSYEALNKWKIAMSDVNYEQGIIPTFNHPVNMTNTINALEKEVKTDPKRQRIIDAIKAFIPNDSVGVSIPMDRVRFIVLCNLDLEDPKSFRGKMKSAVPPILDRVKYKRINVDWEKQWGWTAYVLSQSQPFEGHHLTTDQKIELMSWMYSNWDKLRSTSYRTVRRLAEAMINDPEHYVDQWQQEMKGH